LTKWGLTPFISICLSSTEVGLEKPDPAVFQLALSQSGCKPSQAVMIGDRLDNDIRPARLLGWTSGSQSAGALAEFVGRAPSSVEAERRDFARFPGQEKPAYWFRKPGWPCNQF
jgi:FMN phosphatase YigB (HAD superfamily)